MTEISSKADKSTDIFKEKELFSLFSFVFIAARINAVCDIIRVAQGLDNSIRSLRLHIFVRSFKWLR